jgi:metacaspase-1
MNYIIQIGLNSVSPAAYGGWEGKLSDCELDLANLANYLPKPNSMYCLLSQKATKDRVKSSFQSVANRAILGDLVVVQYSGHGSQVTDQNGDEPDGLDETWCLYDGQLIDDEINVWLQGFKAGVKVLILSDSCHSGSVAKILPTKIIKKEGAFWEFMGKVITSPLLASVVTALIQKRDGLLPSWYLSLPTPSAADNIKASVLLISGCQDRETSGSTGKGGIFTNALIRQLNRVLRPSLGTIFENVKIACSQSQQTPNWLELGAGFDWRGFRI